MFSDKIPEVGYSPDITALFQYFTFDFAHILPAVYLVCGVLFAFFLIRSLKNKFI